MSGHRQYTIHQDHRDHLCTESLDPQMMQPRWGELSAFLLVATGRAESPLHMSLANCFRWRWGSRSGAVPSFLNSHSWINKFLQPTLNDVFGGGQNFPGIQHLQSRVSLFYGEVQALGLVIDLSNSKGREAFDRCKFKSKHNLNECLKEIQVDGSLTQSGITNLDESRTEELICFLAQLVTYLAVSW